MRWGAGGFLCCCSPQGATARVLWSTALPASSSRDTVTSHGWQQYARRRLREPDKRCQTPAWGTSIFISILGFFGDLQNHTRSANILEGRGQEACNCPEKFLGRQSETPWINTPCQRGAGGCAAPKRVHCSAVGTSWLSSDSWAI